MINCKDNDVHDRIVNAHAVAHNGQVDFIRTCEREDMDRVLEHGGIGSRKGIAEIPFPAGQGAPFGSDSSVN